MNWQGQPHAQSQLTTSSPLILHLTVLMARPSSRADSIDLDTASALGQPQPALPLSAAVELREVAPPWRGQTVTELLGGSVAKRTQAVAFGRPSEWARSRRAAQLGDRVRRFIELSGPVAWAGEVTPGGVTGSARFIPVRLKPGTGVWILRL